MSIIPVSFHGGHSAEFCDHAEPGSTTREIVRSYYERGFRHVGITEHRPPHTDTFVYPDERAKGHDAKYLRERFARYFEVVRPELQEEWGDRMHLFFGFETEYYGVDPIGQTEELIDLYKPDLLVASVHHVNDIPIDFSVEEFKRAVEECGSVEAVYEAYYDQQLVLIERLPELMQGRPVVIGHFDLIKIFTPDVVASERIRERIVRNVSTAIENGCLFEVNARAFKKGLSEPYPGRAVLKEIQKHGGEVTLGDDSHGVHQVGLYYEEMLPFIREHFDGVTAFEWREGSLVKVQVPL